MKLQEKKGVILFFWTNLLKRRKPQAKHRNKNAWVKPWLKNRADSNAYNNIFAELWLRDAEEGVPFRNVTRIQLLTWLKSEFFYMWIFLRFLTTSGEILFCRTSQWLLPMEESTKGNVLNNIFQGTSLSGPPKQGGRGGVCTPPPPSKKFFDNVPFFFEESFKCVFIENIKSEIVNIQ